MRDSAKAYGPYRDRRGWRVIVHEGGTSSTARFRSEEEAHQFVAGYNGEGSTVQEMIDRYEVHVRAKGLKPRSIVMIEQRLRRLCEPVLGKSISRLTEKVCRELYERLALEVSVDTHRNALIYARTWGRWLVKAKLARENPWVAVEGMGKRKHGKKQLRIDEYRKWEEWALYEAGRGEAGAVAALLAARMGLRAGEITGLRCRDVDDGARLLWVEGTKTDAARRVLDVPEVLRGVLGERVRRVAHQLRLGVSPGDEGAVPLFGEVGDAYVRQAVARICKRAGVPEVTAHGMRGLYATLAATGALTETSAKLGHTSTAVTLRHYVDAEEMARTGAKRVELRLVGGAK